MDGEKVRPQRWSRLYSILGTLGAMWLWYMLIVVLSGLVGGADSSIRAASHPFVGIMPNLMLAANPMMSFGATFFAACVCAPLAEEAIFRGLICHRIAGRTEDGRPKDWWPIIAFSFLLFGFLHTFNYDGVMLQGVYGLMLAMLWYRNGTSQKSSYFSCVLAHASYNFSVLAMNLLFSRLMTEVVRELIEKLGKH